MSDNPFYFGADLDQNAFNMPSYESGTDWNIPESQFNYTPMDNNSYLSGMSSPAPADTSLWDRINFNPSNRKGMDNLFNAGAGALGLLQTGLALKDQEDAKKDYRRTESLIRGQIDPNQQLFQQRIMSMIDNPSGYLNDPVDSNMAAEATSAAERMAAKQGRPGMSMDDLKRIQALKQSSYQNRLRSLIDLFNASRANNAGVYSALGSLASRRPTAGSAAPIMGGLSALYSAGRNIAADSGLASDVRQPANTRYSTLRD